MDKGTVIRTAVLLVALLNHFLVTIGKSPLPFSNAVVEEVVALLFTIITALITWFKNNYITQKGMKQKEVLLEKGLTGKKKKDVN